MKNKIALFRVIFPTVLSFFVAATFIHSPANAYSQAAYNSCVSGAKGIQSMIDVCGQCWSQTGDRGAIWFNDSWGDSFKNYVEVSADEFKSGANKTIYLRGSVYSCNASYVGTGTDIYADHIYFYTSSTSRANGTPFAHISPNNGSLSVNRGKGNSGKGANIWNYSWDGHLNNGGSRTGVTINPKNIFSSGYSNCSTGNSSDVCREKTVHIFRCMAYTGYSQWNTYNGVCGTSPTKIRLVIRNWNVPKPAEDAGNSDTTYTNDGQGTCQVDGASADTGPYYGNTLAQSKITNSTNGQTASSGLISGNSTNSIFAKPDDKIQFAHSLCYGAQGLKNGADTANTFRITANQAKYLFGNKTGIVSGQEVSLTKNQKYPSQVNDPADTTKKADIVTDYGFTVKSPSPASYAVKSDDAGNIIEQDFTHNIVNGWVNKRSKKTGTCSCNTNTATLEKEDVLSYASAKAGGFPIWGDLSSYSCSRGGNCSCRCSDQDGSYCHGWSCSTRYNYSNGTLSFPKTFEPVSSSTKVSQVYVPFNFSTSTSTNFDFADRPLYAGEQANVTATYNVNSKKNFSVSNDVYATLTPSTSKYRVIEFTIDSSLSREDATAGELLLGNRNVSGLSNDNICQYFVNKGVTSYGSCNLIEQKDGSLNSSSNLTGAFSTQYNRSVPDLPVGTKYCVAVGVYPASSHDWLDEGIESDTDYLKSLNRTTAITGGTSWNISNASCRTIAKKPSFQIWNGGLYTNGDIQTSLSKKSVGSGYGSYDTAANKAVFGSWDEQLVIANETINNFASGATLGYAPQLGLAGGYSGDTNFGTNLSPLTISNANNTYGEAEIRLNNGTLLTRLQSRYRPDDIFGDTNFSGSFSSGTTVIYSSGTVTIDGDVCYGPCSSGNALRLTDQNLPTTSIQDLPQVLIFANNIVIKPNVKRIDAWLIADNVNTCDGFSIGTTQSIDACNTTLMINGPVFAKSLSLNRTAGSEPGAGEIEAGGVLAQNLVNDGSITPAEIFNLRSDAYYWSYAQAQNFGEAVVSYSRELAPRL